MLYSQLHHPGITANVAWPGPAPHPAPLKSLWTKSRLSLTARNTNAPTWAVTGAILWAPSTGSKSLPTVHSMPHMQSHTHTNEKDGLSCGGSRHTQRVEAATSCGVWLPPPSYAQAAVTQARMRLPATLQRILWTGSDQSSSLVPPAFEGCAVGLSQPAHAAYTHARATRPHTHRRARHSTHRVPHTSRGWQPLSMHSPCREPGGWRALPSLYTRSTILPTRQPNSSCTAPRQHC